MENLESIKSETIQITRKDSSMAGSSRSIVQNVARTVSDGFFYYFGYGSNLLKERIQVQIKEAVFESIGVLSGHELTFYDTSLRWSGAIASIEPKEVSKVWGCIWKVPNDFADELDIQERGYHRLNVQVNIPSLGKSILCRTYQYSNPDRTRLPPSPHYKHVIVRGAIEHSLPVEYVEELTLIQDNGYKGKVSMNLVVLQELNREMKENGA